MTMAVRQRCMFVSDLHGNIQRFEKLFRFAIAEQPLAIFLGGDLLPTLFDGNFVSEYLIPGFAKLREQMGKHYPRVFLILGNDDPRSQESTVMDGEGQGIWDYIHNRKVRLLGSAIYGYCCVPPTPFRLKDWERYDVSRYCDPGCVCPEEGMRTVNVDESEAKWGTIASDLVKLTNGDELQSAVVLFHAPPYDTPLDRAALDGVSVDHVPLDLHVGSIAIRRFIETRQPLLTLHGHIHESARLTGAWKTNIGRTVCLSAAHDGPELALVRFDVEDPGSATRELL